MTGQSHVNSQHPSFKKMFVFWCDVDSQARSVHKSAIKLLESVFKHIERTQNM